MPEPVSQRLFFALWPDADVAQRVWQAAPVISGVRRLAADQLHITLAYLGVQTHDQQVCAMHVAAGIQGRGFPLRLDRFGHFSRAQVAWLGMQQIPPALLDLQKKLVNQLNSQCGYIPESRPFHPHVSLLRKVKHWQAYLQPSGVDWSVNDFVLASSRSHPGGVQYSVLARWDLYGQE